MIDDIIPANGYALIEPLEQEKITKGGLIMPETEKPKRAQKGKIIAICETHINDKGVEMPIEFKKGDFVLFGAYAGEDVVIDDKEYRLVEIIFIRGKYAKNQEN